MTLETFIKQPGETLDYDFIYDDWFVGRTVTPVSFVIAVTGPDAALVVAASQRVGMTVKVVLSGGTADGKYKVTCRLTTSASLVPLVKEADITVKVKEL